MNTVCAILLMGVRNWVGGKGKQTSMTVLIQNSVLVYNLPYLVRMDFELSGKSKVLASVSPQLWKKTK